MEECKTADETPTSRKRIALRFSKFLMFVTCFFGFTYQAAIFFSNFFEYPTVINVEVKGIYKFLAPAYTVCFPSQIKRSRYCSAYTDHCRNATEAFCANHRGYCGRNRTNWMVPQARFAKYENYKKQRSSPFNLAQDEEPFTAGKYYFEKWFVQTRNKFGVSPFLAYPCFVRDSRLENSKYPSQKIFNQLSSRLSQFWLFPRKYDMFDPSVTPGLFFSIHSPFEPSNPYTHGSFLTSGHSYKIHLRMEEERRLPYPYKTDCIDYEALWEKNNRTGPRSRLMCRDICQRNYSQECRKCHWGLTVYESPEVMCEMDNGKNCSADLHEKRIVRKKINNQYVNLIVPKGREVCLAGCKQECVKRNYHYTIEEREYIPNVQNKSVKSAINIEVIVDTPEVTIRSHKAQYMDVEAFSYIGGFMGIWLGISIWAFAGSMGQTFVKVAKKFKNTRQREKKDMVRRTKSSLQLTHSQSI